ncbi:hypothetical protein MSG28_004332 [Choristoneura fumiferana]|uniref:Uncharacterized protein n=1 Tax=Choristoneura fumiferana TaxID=7141 RepID=A0ACC0KIK4_CHOFU|nr:hypothetical protein MSG28_004332 [Choristoneura fumiferana]
MMKWILILVLCASSVDSTVLGFLTNLPWEIGNSVSSAWTAFKDLVKKPVRIKRLGSGGPRKPTVPPTRSFTADTDLPETVLPTRGNPTPPKRPTLPVFALPTWKTLHRWNHMQQPKLYHTRGYHSVTDRSTYRLLNFLTAANSPYDNLVMT